MNTFDKVVEEFRRKSIDYGTQTDFTGTEERAVKAWQELFGLGEKVDLKLAENIINKAVYDYPESRHKTLAFKGIHFVGLCPHHLLPVMYKAEVVYTSSGIVVGLSKIVRVLQYIGKFPLLQEKMGDFVANVIKSSALKPVAVTVTLHGRHFCINERGAKGKTVSVMTEHF